MLKFANKENEDRKLNSSSISFQLMVLFGIMVLALILATGVVQISMGTGSVLAAQNSLKFSESITVPRGIFYDRNGKRLVSNENRYSLLLNVDSTTNDELDTKKLANLFDTSEEDLLERIKSQMGDIVLATGLTSEDLIRASEMLRSLPISYEPSSERKYRFAHEFAHIIGYTGVASREDVENGYSQTDIVGKYRLEKLLDKELRGVPGEMSSYLGVATESPGIAGNNVVLTIDSTWQRSLHKLLSSQVKTLGAESGAIAVVEVSTGDVWSYVNYPSFNNNLFSNGIDVASYNALLEGRGNPLLDKVIGVQAAPGSIFKLVSAYAALEKGIIEPESMYYSNGCMKIGDHSFCEYGKFALGNLDLRNAIKRSSNIYFCQSSLKLANEQGIPALVNAAADLGIGKKTGIIFEGEASGVMASPEYKSRVFGERWFGGDTCNTAIGQGMVATTPMQMAMVVGTLANSGIRLAPNVIKEINDQSGTFVSGGIAQELAKIPLAHSTEVAILDGMKMAAQEWGGTAAAFLADNPASFRIKTGSAEAVEGVHSWMVGTFQYQGRVFAFAAHIHFGGGSRNVIPVMDEFGNCLYANFPNYCL